MTEKLGREDDWVSPNAGSGIELEAKGEVTEATLRKLGRWPLNWLEKKKKKICDHAKHANIKRKPKKKKGRDLSTTQRGSRRGGDKEADGSTEVNLRPRTPSDGNKTERRKGAGESS